MENGFLRVVCEDCKHERLAAFSCKRRGSYSSCGARRMAESHQRDKLERSGGDPLCRYISRPAVSEKRLALTVIDICYQLKTPYRNGTTHVVFEPLDFIAKLAALVPKPRVNLTRFHGVFAPRNKFRDTVTPGKRFC